jgi:hypothetical protein
MQAFAIFLGGRSSMLGSAETSNSEGIFPGRYPPVDVSIRVNRPLFTKPLLNGDDLSRRSMASLIGCSRHVTEHHLARLPSAGCAWFATGTIKDVFLAAALNRGDHTSPIFIRSKRDHVSRMALWAFNAMSSTRHNIPGSRNSHRFWIAKLPTPSGRAQYPLDDVST